MRNKNVNTSFCFIKNGVIEYIGFLDTDENRNYPGLVIEEEKIDFDKYSKGFDIFEENGKIKYQKNEEREQKYLNMLKQLEEEEKETEKIKDLKNFLQKKELAKNLRLEYQTAELMKEGENKNIILSALSSKKDEIADEIENLLNNLKEKYGAEILHEII